MNRLVDDGRIFLHDGRALRGIGFRGSRTGERSTAADPRPPRASAAVETKKATAMAATIAFFIGNPSN